MHGLQQGNKVLSEIHKEMSIENVEKLMSETQEAIAYQRVRLDELLSASSDLPSTGVTSDFSHL
jgi:charged multivesicular body protein 6